MTVNVFFSHGKTKNIRVFFVRGMALTFTSLQRLFSPYQTDLQEILKTVFSNGFIKLICEQLLAGSRSLEARLTFVKLDEDKHVNVH
jgi:hypothetical protein